jgi:hypothetical protein
VAQAQIISFRLIPFLTHVSFLCTVPLKRIFSDSFIGFKWYLHECKDLNFKLVNLKSLSKSNITLQFLSCNMIGKAVLFQYLLIFLAFLNYQWFSTCCLSLYWNLSRLAMRLRLWRPGSDADFQLQILSCQKLSPVMHFKSIRTVK